MKSELKGESISKRESTYVCACMRLRVEVPLKKERINKDSPDKPDTLQLLGNTSYRKCQKYIMLTINSGVLYSKIQLKRTSLLVNIGAPLLLRENPLTWRLFRRTGAHG